MNWVVYILFFVSGACGLIYEVVWSRMMTLIFGRSVLAVGTVLAAFMLGLAVGSFVLGKYADRNRNPLRLYAMYEIGAGASALIASFLLIRISPLYIWVHSTFGEIPVVFALARFLIAFALLIVPTALMGATLPILSRVVVKRLSHIGRELGCSMRSIPLEQSPAALRLASISSANSACRGRSTRPSQATWRLELWHGLARTAPKLHVLSRRCPPHPPQGLPSLKPNVCIGTCWWHSLCRA